MTAEVVGVALAAALAAGHLWLLARRTFRSRWSLRWMTSALAGGDPPVAAAEDGARLVVLLPCLNEQSLVDETLDYFSSLPGVAEGRVLLVAVTGESEAELNRAAAERIPQVARLWWAEPGHDGFVRHNRGLLPHSMYEQVAALRDEARSPAELAALLARCHRAVPSTAALVDRWIERNGGGVLRLHEPATRGSKATKLNFAIATLRRTHAAVMDDPRTYVGVYDFDSRPARGTFAWLLRAVDERAAGGGPLPTLFQQVPHLLGSGVAALPPTSLPYLWSVAHLERTLGLEGYDHAVESGRAEPPATRPRICMGAGMYLRAHDLAHTGRFPEDSDDIAFGYRLDWLGCRRALIPHPNLVQPVPSAAVLMRQTLRIFRTIWTQRRELEWVRRERPGVAVPRARPRLLAGFAAEHNPELLFATACGAVALAWAAHSAAAGAALAVALYAANACALLHILRMAGEVGALHGQGFRARAPLRTALTGAMTVQALRAVTAARVLAERWLPAPAPRGAALPGVAELKTER